jgi:GT2 family glycosyltransferase
MRISAVVLNWKDTARTVRCVASLLQATEIEHVFVVDNESSGDLRVALEQAGFLTETTWSVVEVAENRGFAAGVNLALSESVEAGFEATLVINNDAVIDNLSVARLAELVHNDPRTGLAAPRIIHPDGTAESAGGFLTPILGVTRHAALRKRDPDFITWACVLVRTEALRDVGLLDERFFMYWEDVDFSLRLRAAGWAAKICHDAVATHEISTNRAAYPIAIKAYHTWSSILFARKHGGAWTIGRWVWLASSAGANALRLRTGALRGLRAGMRLSTENADPAYSSALRMREFGEAHG